MTIWLILAFVFAALEALALHRNWAPVEYFVKPGVMVCLFLWLYSSTGLKADTLWFGTGVLLSMIGDILLMISLDRLFLPGLAVFLLAHVSYIIGFKDQFRTVSAASFLLIAVLAVSAARVAQRIVRAMRAKGESRLVSPVILYSAVISIMLFAAASALFDPEWKPGSALLVSLGALLFYVSDAILAWNKFVAPILNGRIWNIATYHLGQIGLIAGIVSRFG